MARASGRLLQPVATALAVMTLLLWIAATPALAAKIDPRFEAAFHRVETLLGKSRLDDALALSRKLVAVARKKLPKTEPRLALYIEQLAELEAQKGNLSTAETLERELLSLDEASRGPESLDVARRLDRLASLLSRESKLDDAEAMAARALAISEDALGPEAPEVLERLEHLAAIYDRQNRAPEAKELRGRIAAVNDRLRSVLALPSGGGPVAAGQAPTLPQPEANGGLAAPAPAPEPPKPAPEPEAAAPAETEQSERSDKSFDMAPSAGEGEAESAAPPPPPPEPPLPEASAPTEEAPADQTPSTGGKKKKAAKRPAAAAESTTESAPFPAGPETTGNAEYHVVDVFYGTSRKRYEGAARVSYTGDAGDSVELGHARVTVPVTHIVPQVERPWAVRIPGTEMQITLETEDPAKHFTIKSIEALPEDQFLAAVRERMGQSRTYKDQALVFVHGFYNTFDDALYRTAQITYDLQFDGASFLYSWPSAGTPTAYWNDLPRAQEAGPKLREFLSLVAHKTGAKRITVIAHSMGNIPLLEALDESVTTGTPSPDEAIDDVILAAPDLGRDDFAHLVAHLSHVRGGVTLYASGNDVAMTLSRTLNQGVPRAGDTRYGGPVLLPHLDTVDASLTSMQMFRINHNYVAEASGVLCDIENLLRTGLHPPTARSRLLESKEDAQGTFYTFRP